MHYPDPLKILPCGEKISGRDCTKSRRSLNKFSPIKIRFLPKGMPKPSGTYLPDYGGTYGSTGKPFGWSKDIGNRTKNYHGKSPKAPILETMIHFPPSSQSRYCMKEVKDTICDKVDWSIKAGHGFFICKLYFGDPTVNSKIDLSINGTQVFSGIVKKGQLKVIETKVEAKDQFIVLTSNCEKDCNFSMAKLSSIEIMPEVTLPPAHAAVSEKAAEKELCGNSLIKGMLYK